MLTELRLRNLAVIEEVTVPFGPGLNAVTGETGAGKSIVVDAILLVLGARAQPGNGGGIIWCLLRANGDAGKAQHGEENELRRAHRSYLAAGVGKRN